METETSGSSSDDGDFALQGEERREVLQLCFSHCVKRLSRTESIPGVINHGRKVMGKTKNQGTGR